MQNSGSRTTLLGTLPDNTQTENSTSQPLSPNKLLQRAGGQWYLVCESLAVFDEVPMINLGEPPGAELSRWTSR